MLNKEVRDLIRKYVHPFRITLEAEQIGLCKTWLSYNDPSWLAKRNGLGPDTNPTIDAMVAGLSAVAKKVTGLPLAHQDSGSIRDEKS
jgi:hypothetical protein